MYTTILLLVNGISVKLDSCDHHLGLGLGDVCRYHLNTVPYTYSD